MTYKNTNIYYVIKKIDIFDISVITGLNLLQFT